MDGISQPIFFADEVPPFTAHWDPRAKPALMLVLTRRQGCQQPGQLLRVPQAGAERARLQGPREGSSHETVPAARQPRHLDKSPKGAGRSGGGAGRGPLRGWYAGSAERQGAGPAPRPSAQRLRLCCDGQRGKCPFFAHPQVRPRTDGAGPVR
ncbi:MAG: hypothetical protein WKG07_37895 [Hymenobacter sp.]